MVSIIKEWIDMGMLPYWLHDRRKEGYLHFKFDVTNPDPKRIQVKAWKEPTKTKNIPCEGTKFEVCGKKFQNGRALELHQEAEKHGPFAMLLREEEKK